MFDNIFSTMTEEEIIKKINELKKQDKKSYNWKELLIVLVTNNFNTNKLDVQVKFIDGEYKIVFTKMNVTLEELKKYISETSDDDEFYMEALKYIDNTNQIFKDIKIKKLEERLQSNEIPEEETKYYKQQRLNNIFTKIIIVIIILAIIYSCVMLLAGFGANK